MFTIFCWITLNEGWKSQLLRILNKMFSRYGVINFNRRWNSWQLRDEETVHFVFCFAFSWSLSYHGSLILTLHIPYPLYTLSFIYLILHVHLPSYTLPFIWILNPSYTIPVIHVLNPSYTLPFMYIYLWILSPLNTLSVIHVLSPSYKYSALHIP